MADNWVSPDTAVDTAGAEVNWDDELNSIDGYSETYSSCSGMGPGNCTNAIEMTLDRGIQCDKVRIDAGNWDDEEEEGLHAAVNLDVYWDDEWHDVYDGTLDYHVATEKEIDSGNKHLVTKARLNRQNDYEEPVDVRLWEFDFNQVAGIARPLIGGSLADGKKGLV